MHTQQNSYLHFLQVIWLRRLFLDDNDVDQTQLDYVPIYSLGNLCIGEFRTLENATHG